jgi:probable HAF family extracellular repeat protein
VNASGQVVGSGATAPEPNDHTYAYSWTQEDGIVDLGTLGGADSFASAVNDGGQTVGQSVTASGEVHAFLWTQSDGMVDLGTLGGIDSFASAVNSSSQVVGNSVTSSGETHATMWQPVSSGPVDSDGDGIDDAIDTGDGTFQDGATTAGTITLPLPAGYAVTVTDLPDPDGVHVTVAGSGIEKVTIALTNPVTGAPCGTVKLLPGSDVELLCGSITARVAAGSPPVEIVLSDDTSLFVGAGEQATISISPGVSFVVSSVSGGDGKLTLVANGVTSRIGASSARIKLYDFVGFSQPVDNGKVFNLVNAGRIIPLKWRLLTEAGAPITNLSSASVSSAQISCQTSAPTDAIEQVAASASLLQNLGNGYYQLNWKTDKLWTGCKVMRLSLQGEGPITHKARFKFN